MAKVILHVAARARVPLNMNHCVAISLGQIDYTRAFELQTRLHAQVATGALPNLLLLLEHPHVYTLGRRGGAEDVLATPEELAQLGVEVRHVDRGGEVTYHGPGQLVGYPIVSLRSWGGGPLRYVRALEEVLISTLADFGISSESGERPTGVWVGDSKIGAIGVKVSRGVTTHGFALNVDPDLSYFDHIVPCGMPGAQVASMSSLTSEAVSVEQVAPVLAEHFAVAFGWAVQSATEQELGLSQESLVV